VNRIVTGFFERRNKPPAMTAKKLRTLRDKKDPAIHRLNRFEAFWVSSSQNGLAVSWIAD